MSNCARATAEGSRRRPPLAQAAGAASISASVSAYMSEHSWERMLQQPPRALCRRRWLYYRGDDNYGLGNVLYDVASAAAIAMMLNRTLIYGADLADRKFGSLIDWPGVPTLQDVDGLRKHCGTPLARSRHALLAPDKYTFGRTWRRERTHLRCLRRLLSANWLGERAHVIELTKVHAFTGVQLLLKSVHRPLRSRVAQLTGGCLARGAARPNLYGVLLGALMRPVPAVLEAVRWTLRGAARRGILRRPQIALHVRAMSDHRAKNLTSAEQQQQLSTGLRCYASAVAQAEAPGRSLDSGAARRGGGRRRLRVVLVSSSPELRESLAARMRAAPASGGRLEVLTFDWRRFIAVAEPKVALALSSSEEAATNFCRTVNASEAHRCSRAAHLRDWGPDPHWAALVELLLASTAS